MLDRSGLPKFLWVEAFSTVTRGTSTTERRRKHSKDGSHAHTRYSCGDKPNVAPLTHLARRRIEGAPSKPQQPVDDELIFIWYQYQRGGYKSGTKNGGVKHSFLCGRLAPAWMLARRLHRSATAQCPRQANCTEYAPDSSQSPAHPPQIQAFPPGRRKAEGGAVHVTDGGLPRAQGSSSIWARGERSLCRVLIILLSRSQQVFPAEISCNVGGWEQWTMKRTIV